MVAFPVSTIQPTIAAIEAAVAAAEPRDFDLVIRASSIGRPCERELWYRFRWAVPNQQFDGRMLRLFGTGHVEEARMVAWLRMAGVTVLDVNPETGEQWEVVSLDGHFKGHLDGKLVGLIEAPKTWHLLECKTHNARSFAQLKAHGVAVAKPEHVAQMQVYMHLSGLTRGFYLAENKDTSELYSERIEYDATHALTILAKAERIRDAHQPPAKISDDWQSWACRNCAAANVCHLNAFALRNCRTCLHSSPIAGGAWHCARHDRALSIDDQKSGCPNHLYLPGLVPGEQIDADEQAETVTYRLNTGAEWVDGVEVGK
jgi:hypothetical protein